MASSNANEFDAPVLRADEPGWTDGCHAQLWVGSPAMPAHAEAVEHATPPLKKPRIYSASVPVAGEARWSFKPLPAVLRSKCANACFRGRKTCEVVVQRLVVRSKLGSESLKCGLRHPAVNDQIRRSCSVE